MAIVLNSPLAILAGALAALAASAGMAAAQSCTYGVGVTQCRLMLSQPRSFAVEADADMAHAPPSPPATLDLEIDGKTCRVSGPTRLQSFRAACSLELAAAEHVVTARLKTQNPGGNVVTIAFSPSAHLAALPRDAQGLYPQGRRPGLRRFWPF